MKKVIVLPFVLLETISGSLFRIFEVCYYIEPINNIVLSDFFRFFFSCTTFMIFLFIPSFLIRTSLTWKESLK